MFKTDPQKIKFLSTAQTDLLYKSIKRPRLKAVVAVMLECGTRISETLNLRLYDLDFRKNQIRIQTSKRNDDHIRFIPLNDTCKKALVTYLHSNYFHGDFKDPKSFVFNIKHGGKVMPLKRLSINSALKKIGNKNPALKGVHPHMLRHTFATRIINTKGNDLMAAKELLGHTTVMTTEVYTHIPADVIRATMRRYSDSRLSWSQKIRRKLFGDKKILTPIISVDENVLVGRDRELEKIKSFLSKKINVLIIAPHGSGKSALIDNLDIPNLLQVDDLQAVKPALIGILEALLEDKQVLKERLHGDKKNLKKSLNRMSVKNLTAEIKLACEPKEYYLSVDNITRVGQAGVEAIEFLKQHFTIIAAARRLAINKSHFATNFELIELSNLNRKDSLELIARLSRDIFESITDYELYSNHIIEQTDGNPLAIYELVNRYKAEGLITPKVIRDIRRTDPLSQIDISFVFIIGLACMMIFRYLGRANDDMSLQLIGGFFMIFAVLARQLFMSTKRKFL